MFCDPTKSFSKLCKVTKSYYAPTGIRTRVTALKGLCPWPLDERGILPILCLCPIRLNNELASRPRRKGLPRFTQIIE